MYTFATQSGSIPLNQLDSNFTEVQANISSSNTNLQTQINSTNVNVASTNANVAVTQADITTLQGQVAGINAFCLKNRIINGNMSLAQRGTNFAGVTATGIGYYFTDRFLYVGVNGGPAVVTLSQDTSVPSSNEFQYSGKVAVTTADTSIASGDYYHLAQVIEGYNVRDLIGQTFTLSFWVKSSVTGTYCVSFRNQGSPVGTADRSYIAEYTINAANTWEQKTITVTGGLITAGTWNWTNGFGLTVNWALAAGSTYQTTAGAWQTGAYLITSNQVNAVGTVGNTFAITGVQLEKNASATSFEYRPIGVELALCQRYYEGGGRGYIVLVNDSSNTHFNSHLPFLVTKRTSPTGTVNATTTLGPGGTTVASSSAFNPTAEGMAIQSITSTTNSFAAVACSYNYTASAEL